MRTARRSSSTRPDDGVADGTLTIVDSTFAANESNSGFGEGGAIKSDPSLDSALLTITGSTFSGSEAARGGAIFVGSDDLDVTNSTFSGNSGRGRRG